MFNIKMENESVVVIGNIKNPERIENVMNSLNEIALSKESYGLKLILVDSICITSSLIGQLLKFQEDHTYLRLVVGDKSLFELLDSLDLLNKLKVSYRSTIN